MPVHAAAVADSLVLSRGRIRVEIVRRPFAIAISRDDRRLIGGFGLWCADGEAADQFIQFTEGVIASEQLEIPERVVSATLAEPLADGAELVVRFAGGRTGRRGRLRVTLPFDDTVQFRLEVSDAPLRQAAGWDARAACGPTTTSGRTR